MGKSSKSAHFDATKQAVVILMGSLARHLDKDDERIKPIVLRLIQALSTPSQTVQEAVANCLPHLVQSVKEEAPGYINKLLHQLLKGDKYGKCFCLFIFTELKNSNSTYACMLSKINQLLTFYSK